MKRVAAWNSRNSGFTLLELLIVLAILIVIIGILGTTVWGSYKRALIRAANVQIADTLTNAVEEFRMETKRYPTTFEGLFALADMDNPDGAAMGTGVVNPNATTDPMTGGMQQGGMIDPMTGGMQQGGMVDPMTGGMQMGGATDPTTGMPIAGNVGNPVGATGGVAQRAGRPKIAEPFVKEKDLYDPWNNLIKYEWPTTKGDGKRPAIWSCGPDGEDNNGAGDDVINWDANDTSGVARAQNQNMINQNQYGATGGMNGMGMTDPTGGMNGMGMTDPNAQYGAAGGMNGMGMTDPTGGMNGMGMTDPTGGMNPGGMNPGGMNPGGMNPGGMNPGGMNPGAF